MLDPGVAPELPFCLRLGMDDYFYSIEVVEVIINPPTPVGGVVTTHGTYISWNTSQSINFYTLTYLMMEIQSFCCMNLLNSIFLLLRVL